MRPTLLVGGPGTGKTYSLVQKILKEKPKRFALLTFTRQAANEAKQRLRAYYTEKELKYVRTIHSLCFELLGMHINQVFNYKQYLRFGRTYGYEFNGKNLSQEDGTGWGLTEDDQVFRNMTLNIDADSEMKRNYEKYKRENKLYDFNDMLWMASKVVDKLSRFDMLCVDEFQDLAPLQYRFILFMKYEKAIFAADDDQMIFEWAGVSRGQFKRIAESCDIEVLHDIYRMGSEIIRISQLPTFKMKGWRIPKMIKDYRYEVPSRVWKIDDLDDAFFNNIKGNWLVLCRNSYLMKHAADYFRDNYFKFSLVGEPISENIRMCTIHASKGLEADNVVMFSDVSPATYDHITDDAEHRVWYVGLTRARRNLYIVEPRTDCYYDLL